MIKSETAKQIAWRALEDARGHGKPITVCVVDVRGLVVYMERQDGAAPFTSTAAEGKAVGSAFTGLETAVLEELAKNNPSGPSAAIRARLGGHYAPARGGVPLWRGGEVVGAVAVSGATGEEDEASARAAADWFARSE